MLSQSSAWPWKGSLCFVKKEKPPALFLAMFYSRYFTYNTQTTSFMVTKCVCGIFPPHTKKFSNTSWVPYNFTQFWHSLPGDSTRSHRLWAQSYTSDANLKFRLLSVLLTDRLPIRRFRDPLLGFNQLARVVHSTQNKSLLTVYQFIRKGCDKAYRTTSRWKRCIRQDTQQGSRNFHDLSELAALPAPPRVHHPAALQTPYQESAHWNKRCFYHPGSSKGFNSSVSGARVKTKK